MHEAVKAFFLGQTSDFCVLLMKVKGASGNSFEDFLVTGNLDQIATIRSHLQALFHTLEG